jgi:uncharacterized protein (PEP-CTERM system associated)
LQSTFAGTDDLLENKLFARLRQRFTEKISSEGNIAYAGQEYNDLSNLGTGFFERKDQLLTFDVKMLYQFTDWFGADIKYQYARRDSNFPRFDYTNNILTIGAEVKV